MMNETDMLYVNSLKKHISSIEAENAELRELMRMLLQDFERCTRDCTGFNCDHCSHIRHIAPHQHCEPIYRERIIAILSKNIAREWADSSAQSEKDAFEQTIHRLQEVER